MIRKLTAAALGAATALVATSALAQDPAAAPAAAPAAPAAAASAAPSDNSGLSAALLAGYGFNDVFKLGFGARVGYTLPMNLYIGGTFVYHLGTSESVGSVSATENIYYFGGEVGYEIPAGPVMIRPYVGLGLASVSVSIPSETVGGITVGGGSASSSNFYIAPGATLLYPLSSSIGIGVDARFVIVSGANALDAFLTGQYHF